MLYFKDDHSVDGGDCTPKRSRKQREKGRREAWQAGRSHIGLPKPPAEGGREGRHDNDSRVAPRAAHARAWWMRPKCTAGCRARFENISIRVTILVAVIGQSLPTLYNPSLGVVIMTTFRITHLVTLLNLNLCHSQGYQHNRIWREVCEIQ